jgi:hypothetical protein
MLTFSSVGGMTRQGLERKRLAHCRRSVFLAYVGASSFHLLALRSWRILDEFNALVDVALETLDGSLDQGFFVIICTA